MKAIAKCPKCGETLTTSCRACIDSGNYEGAHGCDIEKVEWKKVPETEEELKEVEEK